VNISGSGVTLTFGTTTNFLTSGQTLILGSTISNGTVTLANALDLAGATQTIQVDRGATNTSGGSDAILSGGISNGALTKTGAGKATLSNTNTYTGTTTVSGGTLDVGGTGSLKTSSVAINSGGTLLLSGTGGSNNKLTATTAPAVTLNGGTLKSDASGLDQTFGALTLTANSVIDFTSLASGNQWLRFAASNADWSGLTLSIWNWHAGVDHLYFGTGFSGLDPGQLSRIIFYGDSGVTAIGNPHFESGGELSPIPEPSTVCALVGLFGVIGWRERQRLRGLLGRWVAA
jgi:autotransporter-associated beta strand protein